MSDDIITDLITALVAARADGHGVLTIDAVRGRLAEAKLYVLRIDDEETAHDDPHAWGIA